jgi:cyanophycin synthetase
VTFARTTPTVDAGVLPGGRGIQRGSGGPQAFEDAQRLIRPPWARAFDAEAAIAHLRELDEDERLGPSTGAIVDAAVDRGIPYRRLTRAAWCSLAGAPSSGASRRPKSIPPAPWPNPLARTKTSPSACCTPPVCPCRWASRSKPVDEAWAVARKVGLPVVVKPQDGNQGKGVTVNITDRAQLEEAYKNAADYGTVMVERFLPGHDFRLLVVGDQLVAAARREPPQVLGDGQHTVRELVDRSTKTRAGAKATPHR